MEKCLSATQTYQKAEKNVECLVFSPRLSGWLRRFSSFLVFFLFFAWGCGSPPQHGLVLWAEGDHVLLDIGSNAGLKNGDQTILYREIELTHPASGESLEIFSEELVKASVAEVWKNVATVVLDKPVKVQPGDKVAVTEQNGEKAEDLVRTIGTVAYVDIQQQFVDVKLIKAEDISPGTLLAVAMPMKIIQHPVSSQNVAVVMRKLTDIEVIRIDANTKETEGPLANAHTAICRITQSEQSPLIGDAVVILSSRASGRENRLPLYWFQDLSDISSEAIAQRAYQQALGCYEAGEYWTTIKHLRVIETVNPEYKDTLYLLAACHKQLGLYDRAYEYFDRATRKNPNDAKIWLELAYMYLDQNRLKEAVEVYRRLTTLFPNNVQLWLDLGDIYKQLGEDEKSNEAYRN